MPSIRRSFDCTNNLAKWKSILIFIVMGACVRVLEITARFQERRFRVAKDFNMNFGGETWGFRGCDSHSCCLFEFWNRTDWYQNTDFAEESSAFNKTIYIPCSSTAPFCDTQRTSECSFRGWGGGLQNSRSVELTTSDLVLRLRVSTALLPLCLYAFVAQC